MERFIEFSLGSENYFIPLLMVKEVISIPETTEIPKAPKYFVGLMNLRGLVISIVDLRLKLSIEPNKKKEEAVIIVESDGVSIGIVVDSINKVEAVDPKKIQVLKDLETKINLKYIEGVYQKEEGVVLLLNIVKCLDMEDKRIIQEAA